MKLAFIGPVQILDTFVSQSEGVQMALAQEVLRRPTYREFYLKRSQAGDVVILDNGTFEFGKPLPIGAILEAADMVEADIVVAPDFPGKDWKRTFDALGEFVIAINNRSVLGIPQSRPGDIDGWLECLRAMDSIPTVVRLGISILSCPIAFGRHTGVPNDIELNRFAATTLLRQAIEKAPLRAKLHYLGLGTRVEFIQYYTIADSLDTSSPIWNPWNYCKYTSGSVAGGKTSNKVNFDAILPEGDLRWPAIQNHIDTLKSYARIADKGGCHEVIR